MNYYQKGYIDVKVVAIMSTAFIAGGWLGSKLSLALPPEAVKRVFGILLFYTSIRMMGLDQLVGRWLKNIFS